MSNASPARIAEETPPRADEADFENDDPPPPGIVSLDLRSLALFRIAFGLVILLDLLLRLPAISDFYVDSGVLPRAYLITLMRSLGAFSLNFMSGEWGVQLALFLITIVVMCCFTVGYRTRLSAVLAWFLTTSMQGRNPFILHGGDDMIRIFLFWCIFAPLNGRWSLDAALNRDKAPLPVLNASWGTQALMFQLCFVYWFTAAWKWHPVWTTEGSALYYALNLDQFVRPFGQWLLQFPGLLRFMTRATISLEFFGPFLLFVPFWTRWFRILAISSFIGLHMGIFLTMQIGLFPWTCIAAWLMFLPSIVWDGAEKALGDKLRSLARRTVAFRTWIAEGAQRIAARFGKPPAPQEELGPVGSVFVVAYSLVVFTCNFMTLPQVNGKVPLPVAVAEVILGLHQRWAMFAPYPSARDGWYQVVGTQSGGRRLDIWNGGAPTDARPANVLDTYRDVRWNKYLSMIAFDDPNRFRPYFARYFCLNWNASHSGDDRIDHVAINYFLKITPPPGKPFPPVQRQLFWQQSCSGVENK